MTSTKKKSGRGGKRPGAGPPAGRVLPRKTIERIRATINTKLAIDTLHRMAERGGQHDGVRVSAAATLLKYTLPAYAPVDNDGETAQAAVFVFEKVDG